MKFTAFMAAAAMSIASTGAVAAPAAKSTTAVSTQSKSSNVRASGKAKGASRLSVAENPYVSLAMAAVAVGGILLIAGAVSNDEAADSN